MTTPTPQTSASTAGEALAAELTAAGTKALRALKIALGLAGLVTLVVGILILVWPGRSAVVGTAILAVYAILVGLIYLGVALFSSDRGAWSRIGHIVLAAPFVGGGISAFSNLQATTAVLAVFLAVLIGALWVIEGIVSLLTIKGAAEKTWTVIFAIVSVIAGITLLSSPLWSAAVPWWRIGISLGVLGLVQIVRAVTFGKGLRVA